MLTCLPTPYPFLISGDPHPYYVVVPENVHLGLLPRFHPSCIYTPFLCVCMWGEAFRKEFAANWIKEPSWGRLFYSLFLAEERDLFGACYSVSNGNLLPSPGASPVQARRPGPACWGLRAAVGAARPGRGRRRGRGARPRGRTPGRVYL